MKKKIAIIGTVGVPSKYGGFETLVENILDYIGQNFDVTVFCQATAYKEQLNIYKNSTLIYLPLSANGASSILYDIFSILKSFRKNDVLLVMGVSGALIFPIIKPFFKGKIITNIDGLEWKRDKWGRVAKKYLKFAEKLSVLFSDVVVSDNLYIQHHVKETYKRESVLISYGGDHVKKNSFFYIGERYRLEKEKYFFTVCRIEPENNLDIMVQAYEASNSFYPYVIVGNFLSSEYGIQFKSKYERVNGLKLLDPIYDQEILDQLRSNCYYYLHGHSAGGTNPSLVEAMFLALPIIAYGVNYNRATTHHSALYFNSADELKSLLINISSVDRELLKSKLYTIANAEYKWEKICNSYMELF